MSSFQRIAFCLSIVSCAGMLMPAGPIARASAENPHLTIVDATLGPSGSLSGRMTDQDQVPRAGLPIALSQAGSYLATTMTDVDGRFSFSGLRGGVYGLSTGNDSVLVRAWMPGTAPPHATTEVSLMTSTGAVRGQGPVCMGMVPMACLGMSATALALSIILPIALDDDDEEAS